jgi:hypothetical protein
MHTVDSFHAELVGHFSADPIPSDLRNEADLEKRFVLPIVYTVHQQFPKVHIHAHPWKRTATCTPSCAHGSGLIAGPQIHGCPDCWEASKSWAAVRLYGLHCFDLVIGTPQDSLVVELKLLHRARRGNRKANDGFQRLVGQCILARLIHPRVIGFCVAESGALDMEAVGHLEGLQQLGIQLLVRQIDRPTSERAG